MSETSSAPPLGNARSLQRGECTIEELRRLCKPFVDAGNLLSDDMMDGYEDFAFDFAIVDGDLSIDGNFNPNEHGMCFLLVRGTLRVSGTYRDHDDPATGVYVCGNLEAKNVITRGSLGVGGDLLVGDVLAGDYNDYGAQVDGNARAKVFVPENHFFEFRSGISFEVVIGGKNAAHRVPQRLRAQIEALTRTSLRERLVPELVEGEEDGPDHETLLARVAAGLPLLRS